MKKFLYFILMFILISAAALSGCGGGNSKPGGGGPNPGSGDPNSDSGGTVFNPSDGGQGTGVVYCGGYYMDGELQKPCYWASNLTQRINLEANGITSAAVNGICLYDRKVYCIGNDYTGSGNVPYYWIDSQRYSLNNDNSIDTVVQCFSIMNGKVYCGGYVWTNFTTCVPSYWEAAGATNTRYALSSSGPGGMNQAKVWSCFAYGNKVYFGGTYTNNSNSDIPCYWDGKTAVNIHPLPFTTDFFYGLVKYIQVSDTRIDCIGIGGVALAHSTQQGSSITTQDVARDQSDGTNTACMYNGMVYSAGALWVNNNWAPCCWVGFKRYDLPIGDEGVSGCVMSLCVSNGVAYCGGYYNDGTKNIPCYWVIDGDNIALHDFPDDIGVVKTIFVD